MKENLEEVEKVMWDSGLTSDQIELRLLEKIADDIAIRDYPSLSKTSKSIILKYFEKLIKEKTDSFKKDS